MTSNVFCSGVSVSGVGSLHLNRRMALCSTEEYFLTCGLFYIFQEVKMIILSLQISSLPFLKCLIALLFICIIEGSLEKRIGY